MRLGLGQHQTALGWCQTALGRCQTAVHLEVDSRGGRQLYIRKDPVVMVHQLVASQLDYVITCQVRLKSNRHDCGRPDFDQLVGVSLQSSSL